MSIEHIYLKYVRAWGKGRELSVAEKSLAFAAAMMDWLEQRTPSIEQFIDGWCDG
jgi:hypothetical protein